MGQVITFICPVFNQWKLHFQLLTLMIGRKVESKICHINLNGCMFNIGVLEIKYDWGHHKLKLTMVCKLIVRVKIGSTVVKQVFSKHLRDAL